MPSLPLEDDIGSLLRNVQTTMHSTPNMIETQIGVKIAKYIIEAPKQINANDTAYIFTFLDGNALFSCHSLMIGPKHFEFVSQERNLSEERAKQNAERSIKGVVGSPGNMIPTAPAARDSIPTVSQAARRRMVRCLL